VDKKGGASLLLHPTFYNPFMGWVCLLNYSGWCISKPCFIRVFRGFRQRTKRTLARGSGAFALSPPPLAEREAPHVEVLFNGAVILLEVFWEHQSSS